MKITTAQFLELSGTSQRALILDGLIYAKIHSRQFAIDIQKLNGWLATLDVVDVDPQFIQRFLEITKELSENIDLLTEKFVDNASHVTASRELINRKKLSDRLKPQ